MAFGAQVQNFQEKYDLFYLAKLLPLCYVNKAASAVSHYVALKKDLLHFHL